MSAAIVRIERPGASEGLEDADYLYRTVAEAQAAAQARCESKYELKSGRWIYPSVTVEGEVNGARFRWRY